MMLCSIMLLWLNDAPNLSIELSNANLLPATVDYFDHLTTVTNPDFDIIAPSTHLCRCLKFSRKIVSLIYQNCPEALSMAVHVTKRSEVQINTSVILYSLKDMSLTLIFLMLIAVSGWSSAVSEITF